MLGRCGCRRREGMEGIRWRSDVEAGDRRRPPAAPEVRAVLEKYYAGAVPGEQRLRLANFVSDLTARDYGGYQRVLATHAEGSFEAEKMQILRSFDASRAVAYVRDLAGLPPE